MSDDPDYDPNLDWVPPAKVYMDEVLVNDVGPDGLGPNQPFWKVLLWHTAQGPHRDAPQRQRRRASALPR